MSSSHSEKVKKSRLQGPMIAIVFYLWWHLSHPWDCLNHLTSSHSSCTIIVFSQIQKIQKYEKARIQNYHVCYGIILENFLKHCLGPWGLIGAFHFRSSVPLNWLLGRQICVVFTKLAFGRGQNLRRPHQCRFVCASCRHFIDIQ